MARLEAVPLAVLIAFSVLSGSWPYVVRPSVAEAFANNGSENIIGSRIIAHCDENYYGLEAWQLTVSIAQCPTLLLSEANDTRVNGFVKMAGSGSHLYVVWSSSDPVTQPYKNIVFKRSTDNGETFESMLKINGNDQPIASAFQIAADGPYVY